MKDDSWGTVVVIAIVLIIGAFYLGTIVSDKDETTPSSGLETTVTPVVETTQDSAPVESQQPARVTWDCVDVTSYDYNWDNDMRCTSSAGEVVYRDYAGARALEAQ